MTIDQLRNGLACAANRSDWVDRLGEYFAAHDLHYGHGTDCPEDEAFWLVWHLSGHADDPGALPVDPDLIDELVELAARRVTERMPLAYLLGSAWFSGLEFVASRSALVPRSPLAELVEQGFSPWISLQPGDRLLEIGTGSGCIAIAAAVHNPTVQIDATDTDPGALALARHNVALHDTGDRVRLFESDLFPPGAEAYRVIMSNPPYVPTAVARALPPEYQHEPFGGFDGGEDGLDVIRRILGSARERLTDDGILVVEVGLAADALNAAYPQVPWTWLEFERGGDGVFLLTAHELQDGW